VKTVGITGRTGVRIAATTDKTADKTAVKVDRTIVRDDASIAKTSVKAPLDKSEIWDEVIGALAIMDMTRRLGAEFFGTFWLTFAGCGSAILAAGFPGLGIGFLGVSFAFGLSVLTMAYAVGHISGCHLNPAVTVGLAAGGRFPAGQIVPYVVAQVVGAVAAATLLYVIASGAPGFDLAKGFAANGYAEHSPGHYSLLSALLTEVLMTMMFLFIIMGSTHGRAPAGFAPLAIGLGLTLIHLVSIPITNTSVNPARSTGPALIVGGWALTQLWLFWLAPLIGGALGGVLYRWISTEPSAQVVGDPARTRRP